MSAHAGDGGQSASMGMDRVDLGGRPPRPPQIRTCPSKRHPVRHVVALSLARSGGFMVTRGRGSVSSACLQPSVHDAAPPSLPGVREGPFPRFVATMGRCDSLPAISPRFVSFAWRYHRFVPVSSPQARDGSRGSAWILVSRDPDRQSRWRRQGLPSSRETRSIIRHVPPTPV